MFFLVIVVFFFIFYYLTNQVIYCILNTLYRAGKTAPWVKIPWCWELALEPWIPWWEGKTDSHQLSSDLPTPAMACVCAPTQRPTHNDNKVFLNGNTMYRRRVDTKMLLWICFCSLLTSGAARMVMEVRGWASGNVFNRLPALFFYCFQPFLFGDFYLFCISLPRLLQQLKFQLPWKGQVMSFSFCPSIAFQFLHQTWRRSLGA